MAALLHQAAPPTAKPPHPWALHSTTPSLLSPLSRRRRRRAPAIRSAATDSSFSTGGDGDGDGDAAAPSSKKTTRKEKQQERRRQQDVQGRQQQLLMMEEAPREKQDDGGTGSSSSGSGGVGDDEDELPQPVFDRILRRIAFTVGLPMASGVALLSVYDALKRNQGVVVPSWVPLLTTLVAFGTSALGIAYGTLSASWDPDREGSLLGIDEARANWPVLWQEEIQKEKEKKAKAKQMKK